MEEKNSDNIKKENMEDNHSDNPKKKKSAGRIILLILAIVVFVCACVYICIYIYNYTMAQKESEIVTTPDTTDETDSLADNPVDFDSLQEQNDEIYAWIKIEDTEVDYPIVQSASDDEFYLKHSAYDKSWLASGAIYTESVNSTDFSDPVTLIYGHNGYGDTMFTTLHYFEDEDFFESHEYFYIYLPGRKLTYQVISAFKYDDRHIMNSFDFSVAEDLAEFQKTVTNPNSTLKNVRTELDTEIDENSKIVVLSTCITNQDDNRYLVCGVLVNDEETN